MLSRGTGASSTNAYSSSKNHGPGLLEGTTVLLDTWRFSRGILTEGLLFDDAGKGLVELTPTNEEANIGRMAARITEMSLPLTSWPRENFASQASTAGGGTLNLPKGTVVVLAASNNPRGIVVEGSGRAPASTTSDVSYTVAYYSTRSQGSTVQRMYCNLNAQDLAVPLETWSTPWPRLPAGTIVGHHGTTPRAQLQIVDGQPSADGLYDIAYPDGKLRRGALHELVVPFTSWSSVQRCKAGEQRYPQLPAGMRVLVGAREGQSGTLQNGPTTHAGTYEADFPGVKWIHWSGMELTVPLETCLHLHQIAVLKSKVTELEEKETSMADKLANQKAECEKAEERIGKITQGKKLILSAANEHDYGSNFPSPADLVRKIGIIEGQSFADWVEEAFRSADDTWMVSEGAAKAIRSPRNFVLQVLVETVRECHRRVQECVSSRTRLLRSFVGDARSHLAEDIAIFERSAFLKGYKEMFADVCPASPDDQTKLAREVFGGLPPCASVSEISPKALTALFDKTRVAYEEIINGLLLTFLECEVSRSVLLKFSDNFASPVMTWNSTEHNKNTFDPSDGGDKLVEDKTQVKVVIPRLFWEKEEENGEKRKVFETKASFVILSA